MKILLIEDRGARQKLFTKETNISIENYSDILDNFVDDKYDKFLKDILNDNFDFTIYDIIITHKSAFGDDNIKILSIIKEYCKNYNKPLVLFSGGISSNYYNDTDNEILELNSKTFYSKNLVLFMEDLKQKNQNLLILCYGEDWRLNIALNTLEKLNKLIETEEKLKYRMIIRTIDRDKLNQADINYYEMDTENNNITEEAIKLRDSIFDYISELADE